MNMYIVYDDYFYHIVLSDSSCTIQLRFYQTSKQESTAIQSHNLLDMKYAKSDLTIEKNP